MQHLILKVFGDSIGGAANYPPRDKEIHLGESVIREVLEWSPAEFSIPPACLWKTSHQPAAHLNSSQTSEKPGFPRTESVNAIELISSNIPYRPACRSTRSQAMAPLRRVIRLRVIGFLPIWTAVSASLWTRREIPIRCYLFMCLFVSLRMRRCRKQPVLAWLIGSCSATDANVNLWQAATRQEQEQLRVWLLIGTPPATTSFVWCDGFVQRGIWRCRCSHCTSHFRLLVLRKRPKLFI